MKTNEKRARQRPLESLSFPQDNNRLANLCGALDDNLHQIENAFDITIGRRGEHFTVEGKNARSGVAALRYFYQRADASLSLDDIQLGLIELNSQPQQDTLPETIKRPQLLTRKTELHGRTPRQTAYLNAIQEHDITFGIGPAGTGKTFLAVASAVNAFERGLVSRIVLTRPAVEAGERLGFLPGDLSQKVDPYLRPLYDALYELVGADRVAKLFERGSIEIAPLAYMRGRTLSHAFVILDEAQNTTPEQMKMFLTRIGIGAKAVVTGDVTQIDLPRGQKSGLVEARKILAKVRGIGFSEFLHEDVVRHPLVARIIQAYEAHENRTQTPAEKK